MAERQDQNRWNRRDRKLRKRVQGMQVSGKSVKLLQEIIQNKAKQAQEKSKNAS